MHSWGIVSFGFLLLSWIRAISAVELDKFTANGMTTYCRVSNGMATMAFSKLPPESAGKCPVSISMSATVKSYTNMGTVFDVEWNVSANPNYTRNDFPVEILNESTFFKGEVQACSVESKCEKQADIESSVAFGEDRYSTVLNIHDMSILQLQSYRLQLQPKGEYMVIGHVNVRTGKGQGLVDIYAFQRVLASSNLSIAPGTVKPATVELVRSMATKETPYPAPARVTPTQATLTPVPPLAPVVQILPTLAPDPSTQPPVESHRPVGQSALTSGNAPSQDHSPTSISFLFAGVGVAVMIAMFLVVSRNQRPHEQSVELPATNFFGVGNRLPQRAPGLCVPI